jgi:hypothetical protein
VAESNGHEPRQSSYSLKALLDKTLVKIGNVRNRRNRRSYAYLLTRAGVAARTSPTARCLKRQIAECKALRRGIWELRRNAEEVAFGGRGS